MPWTDPDLAVVGAAGSLSWGAYREFCKTVCDQAGLAGLRARSRVPISQPDAGFLMALILGTWDAGAVPAPINARWPEKQAESAIRLLAPARPVVRNFNLGDAVSFREDVAETGQRTAGGPLPPFFAREDDTEALMVFTSGSSGGPKAAALSFRNLHAAAERANRAIPLQPGDRWLLSLPLYHVGGIGVAMRCALAGATIAVPPKNRSLSDSIASLHPTHVSLVATQLYRLLRDDAAAAALARCTAVVMGGGPTPESLVREAVARGIPLVMSYGMTETAAMICCTRPGDSPDRLRSSGRPLADGTVSISADGEILVRGDQLFLGYVQPGGSYLRPLTEDGWFRTGDLGRFDDAGDLHVTGRRDNMFISGGENIQPEEIEAEIRELDGVEEAIVVAVEDPEWGKRGVAFVRSADGRAFDVRSLQSELRKALPAYKVPRTIHPWPEDLASPGIKPARRDFEARARELAAD